MSFRRRSTSKAARKSRKHLTSYYSVSEHRFEISDEIDLNFNDHYSTNIENEPKIYTFGEDNSGVRFRGPPQKYQEILEHHIRDGTLFNDENFPVECIAMTNLKEKVVWKRPFEIVESPEFILDGASRFDITQGKLGDCWFLAAVANLTCNQNLFQFVVPPDQGFSENYAGIFHFRFWQYGRWVDIVIDDRLPTVDNKLIYLKSEDPNEFWPPLIEKAYAKLYGSYKNIEGGQISEALEDMSGGLSEYYEAKQVEIFEIISTSYERASFMGCSINSSVMEGRRPDGLITSHAYSITKVVPLTINDKETRLIRIRNPWGNDAEWNGAWSDHSPHWNLLPDEVRQTLLTRRVDGEFWMDLDDFQQAFSYLDICHINPNSLFYFDNEQKRWHVNVFEGAWIANVTAGGGVKCTETFAMNPQYFFSISGSVSKKYAIVIGLMQKYRRILRADEMELEIAVYAVNTSPGKLLDAEFFRQNQPLANEHATTRQLTVRMHLPVGKYCIVPCTRTPNMNGEYLLRVFSEIDSNLTENDDELEYTASNIPEKQMAVQLVDTTFRKSFRKIAGDDDEIGWKKVQKMLNKVYIRPQIFCFAKPKKLFSKDTCRNLVTLWDKNYSGKLDYEEFWELMTDIATLKIIFKQFDKDNSGALSGFEMRNLLAACGYKVNKHILNIIMLRYGVHGSMNFENFVVCACKLKIMIHEFHERKTANEDVININKRDFLQTTMYS